MGPEEHREAVCDEGIDVGVVLGGCLRGLQYIEVCPVRQYASSLFNRILTIDAVRLMIWLALLFRSVPTVLVNRDRPTAISVTMTLEIGRCQLRRF